MEDTQLLRDYLANYNHIAQDHIEAWRKTGLNPFQDPRLLKLNEDTTIDLVMRYTKPGDVVLDAGCGMGDLMVRLADRDMTGCDIAAAYLAIARERGLRVDQALVEDMPYVSEQFDAVVATDVLEHVLDVNAAVREMLRVLRPGGHLITRVPDRDPVDWHVAPERPYPFVHLRIFDEGTLRLLFDRIFGCEIVECLTVGNSIHAVARTP